MNRKIAFVCAAVSVLLLCACGKKENTVPAPIITPPPAEQTAQPVATSAPAEYNSIDKVSSSERTAVKDELIKVMDSCRDIYKAADKGESFNIVLSDSTVKEMVDQLGSLGYCAIDNAGELNMRGWQTMDEFASGFYIPGDISATYYSVFKDGQISAYHLYRTDGTWKLITMSAAWDNKYKASIYSEGQYVIGDVRYTDKGWLIYNRDYSSFDENQKSNSASYVFVRVKPYDDVMRQLCKAYIEPIGYLENNLFTTNWTSTNYTPIDFNSLYSSLFARYNGTDALTAYNAQQYYTNIEGTALYLVPTATFENTVRTYFGIAPLSLRAISDYSSTLGGYFFIGYDKDYYNVTPRTPFPEVTDYWYNANGSLTMRVDAVNKWYGTDKAFTHEVTVMQGENGSFEYLSNRFYDDANNIVPENKLSYLLDIERAKTKY